MTLFLRRWYSTKEKLLINSDPSKSSFGQRYQKYEDKSINKSSKHIWNMNLSDLRLLSLFVTKNMVAMEILIFCSF